MQAQEQHRSLSRTSEPARPAQHTGSSIAEREEAYRSCCGAAWRKTWRGKRVEYCEPDEAASTDGSSFSCLESDASGPLSEDGAWFCEARQLTLNSSAVRVGNASLAVPTSSQKALWRPRALLLGCRLRRQALRRPKLFKMLLKHMLPDAVAELGPGAHAADPPAEEEAAAAAAGVTVFVARYSVKNFFLGHFDLLQLTAVLLQLGDDFSEIAQARHPATLCLRTPARHRRCRRRRRPRPRRHRPAAPRVSAGAAGLRAARQGEHRLLGAAARAVEQPDRGTRAELRRVASPAAAEAAGAPASRRPRPLRLPLRLRPRPDRPRLRGRVRTVRGKGGRQRRRRRRGLAGAIARRHWRPRPPASGAGPPPGRVRALR